MATDELDELLLFRLTWRPYLLVATGLEDAELAPLVVGAGLAEAPVVAAGLTIPLLEPLGAGLMERALAASCWLERALSGILCPA